MSRVTIAETRYGIERLAIVDPSVIWRRVVEEGKAMPHTFAQSDLFIASTAIRHGPCVVTRNVDGFHRARVPLLNPWTDTHPRLAE